MFSQFKEKLAKASQEAAQKLKTANLANKSLASSTITQSTKQLNEPIHPSEPTLQANNPIPQNEVSLKTVSSASTNSLLSKETPWQSPTAIGLDISSTSPPVPNHSDIFSTDIPTFSLKEESERFTPKKNPTIDVNDPSLYPECLIPLPESPPPPRYQLELQTLRTKVTALQTRLHEAHTFTRNQQTQFEKRLNELTQLHQSNLNEAQLKLQSKTQALAQLQKEMIDVTSHHQRTLTELQSTHDKEIKNLQTQHQAAMSGVESKHQIRLSECKTQSNQVLNEQQSKFQNQLKEIQSKHQLELQQLQSKYDSLMSMTVSKTEFTRLHQDLEVLQASYQRCTVTLKETETKLKELGTTETQLRETLATIESEKTQLNSQLQQLQLSHTELQQRYQDLESQCQQTQEQLLSKGKDIDALKQTLEAMEMEGKAAEAKYTQTLKLLQKQKQSVPESIQSQILRLTSELDAKTNLLHQYMQKETQFNLDRSFQSFPTSSSASSSSSSSSTSPSITHVQPHTSTQLQKLPHARLVEINLKLQTLLEEQTLKANQLQEDVARLNSCLMLQQIHPVATTTGATKRSGKEIGPGQVTK